MKCMFDIIMMLLVHLSNLSGYTNYRFFYSFSMFFFSIESENDIFFKPIGKKLLNFKINYSLCNTEKMLIFILPL